VLAAQKEAQQQSVEPSAAVNRAAGQPTLGIQGAGINRGQHSDQTMVREDSFVPFAAAPSYCSHRGFRMFAAELEEFLSFRMPIIWLFTDSMTPAVGVRSGVA
jgi:hypothetical protein